MKYRSKKEAGGKHIGEEEKEERRGMEEDGMKTPERKPKTNSKPRSPMAPPKL